MINTINMARCIQEAHHVGYTKFYNVCTTTGDFTSVPWGSLDWAGFVLFGGFMAVVTAAMTATIAAMAYSLYQEFR